MLPDSWIDALFARLTLRYGAAFARQWPDVAIHAVKADWRAVLARLSGEAIAYGLQNLPADRPPNALQFRALCNGGPRSDAKLLALSAPVVPPPPHIVERLAEIRRRATGHASRADQLASLAIAEHMALEGEPLTSAEATR